MILKSCKLAEVKESRREGSKGQFMLNKWSIVAVLLLAGCATVPTTPASVPHVGESPQLNVVVERPVGETIYVKRMTTAK